MEKVTISPMTCVKAGFFFTIGAWFAKTVVAAIAVSKGKQMAKKATNSVVSEVKKAAGKLDYDKLFDDVINRLKENGIAVKYEDEDGNSIIFTKE